MKKRIYHYEIHAYSHKNIENDTLYDATSVSILHALSDNNAIEQAKKLVDKPFYRISRIWECHDCERRPDVDTFQQEILKLMGKEE